MKNWRKVVGAFALIGVALFAVFGNVGDNQQSQASNHSSVVPLPGNVAPDFTVKDMEGNQVQLSSFKGKPVLLNFWASWCQPCKLEMPDLVQQYEKYKDQVVFLGINATGLDPDAGARKQFVQEFNVKYPNLLDQIGDETGKITETYQVIAIPTTVTINSQGVIVDRVVGVMTPEKMAQVLQNLLK